MEGRGNGAKIAAVPLALQQQGVTGPPQGVAAESGEKKGGDRVERLAGRGILWLAWDYAR